MNKKISSMAADIASAISEGTKKWTKTRKSEERRPAMRHVSRAAYEARTPHRMGRRDDAGADDESLCENEWTKQATGRSPPDHVQCAPGYAEGCTGRV